MSKTADKEIKIDAVFLWVDGSDSLHQEKMSPFLPKTSQPGSKEFRTRYHQVDEIELSVRSTIKFAAFVKNIFIITDSQTPAFILDYNKNKKDDWPDIKIIDHKVVFRGYEQYLPVFNPIPIETMFCNIPGLSEHFIYLNDDFFLIKKCQPSDFFVNGKPVLRGKWTKFDENIWYKKLYKRTLKLLTGRMKIKNKGYKIDQQNSAKLLGFKKYFRIHHTPAPIRRSTLQDYYVEHPSFLENALKPKFRSAGQCNVQSLTNHLEISAMSAVLLSDFQFGYFQSYKKPIVWYKLIMFLYKINSNKKFLTLQNLDLAPRKTLFFFIKRLTKLVGPTK